MKINMPDGFTLDFSDKNAQTLQKYAKKKGLKQVAVCLSKDLFGYHEYLVYVQGQPRYSSNSFKRVIAYIDDL